jgi:hypothetical protein
MCARPTAMTAMMSLPVLVNNLTDSAPQIRRRLFECYRTVRGGSMPFITSPMSGSLRRTRNRDMAMLGRNGRMLRWTRRRGLT